jgi:hypothetical protein
MLRRLLFLLLAYRSLTKAYRLHCYSLTHALVKMVRILSLAGHGCRVEFILALQNLFCYPPYCRPNTSSTQ